jgi:NAD(P)-dependent dehydrogenase (short-subunit alcohol dehydrogenase family)
MAARLTGRTAVVTGAATGIGRACALAYAAEGARAVVADIDHELGAATVSAIEAAGGVARFVPCDVALSADCNALVAGAVAAFGGIDILHANAGIELCKSVWDTTDVDWERIVAVNLGGSFYCARAAMHAMRESGRGGVLIFTASPHAFMTSREIAAYAATKGGQVALMRALALEGAPYGIRVNALLPGAIETPMLHREAAAGPDPVGLLRQFAAAHPLDRLGQPVDIARVAVFLASDDAAFMTGTCVAVDGGLMAAINSGPSISYTGGPE